jgi:hypothetical protein
MGIVFSGAERRRVVWAWHIAGTDRRCRLLWKLDDVGARIWAENHDVDLEKIQGSEEVRHIGPGTMMRGRAFQRAARSVPAQVRRLPRR